jgi:uncharacterized membrane protein
MIYLIGYLTALATFLVLDVAWLSVTIPRFYRPVLGDMLAPHFSLVPAIVFYLLYPLGLLIFAIKPAFKSGSIVTAIIYGALFGFFVDTTRDLFNLAILRSWSLQITMIDLVQASVLSAAVAAVGFWVATHLKPLPAAN